MNRNGDPLDLGGGLPDLTLFPVGELAECAARILNDRFSESLQYAPTEGHRPLREQLAQRLRRRGCVLDVEQVIVTHGSQQALATLALLLTSPTRAVALEQPGYPGAIQAFSLARAPILDLPVTDDGWDLSALKDRCPAALYVIPHFQNPSGRRASRASCEELVRYAEAKNALLIEDDAYGELSFDHKPVRPILADAPERVLLIGTFSKTLCPGMRVGWIVAPHALVPTIVRILQATSLQPGTLSQYLASSLLERIDYEAHLCRLRATYQKRALALHARCSAMGWLSRVPDGGFFLWARSPINATRMAERGLASGVLSVPESAFRHAHYPGPDQHLRMAFSRYLDQPSQRAKLQALRISQ